MPNFSVILPVYNRATTLDRCLESLSGQTRQAEEIVVVDDGSVDGTMDLLSGWQTRLPRMKVLSQQNKGVAAARNRAIGVSSGDWLAFLDSDDEWYPNKLEIFTAEIENNTEIDLIHSDRVAADGTSRSKQMSDISPEKFEDKTFLLGGWNIAATTLAVRRDTYDRTGGFIENLYSCSDYEFFWRALALSRKIRYMPMPLANMHNGPLGMARALSPEKRLRDNLRAMASAILWMENHAEVPPVLAQDLGRWRDREFKELVRTSYSQGHMAQALKELLIYARERFCPGYWYIPKERVLG